MDFEDHTVVTGHMVVVTGHMVVTAYMGEVIMESMEDTIESIMVAVEMAMEPLGGPGGLIGLIGLNGFLGLGAPYGSSRPKSFILRFLSLYDSHDPISCI